MHEEWGWCEGWLSSPQDSFTHVQQNRINARHVPLEETDLDTDVPSTGACCASREFTVLSLSETPATNEIRSYAKGKTEGRRRRGWQGEMVAWHHQPNGHKFEQTLGDSEGQGSLAHFSPWGPKELDTTGQLNNNAKPKNKSWRFSLC